MRNRPHVSWFAVPLAAGVILLACGTTVNVDLFEGDGGKSDASGIDTGVTDPDTGSTITPDGAPNADGGPLVDGLDPTTCAEALTKRSYLGCDYWPTITPNPVWSIFDFAALIVNPGKNPADVIVTGQNGFTKAVTVAPGAVRRVVLPWIPALKGADVDECGTPPDIGGSAIVVTGAYHVVSSVPVAVYQFNALEQKGVGGEPGKDWSQCPGTVKTCASSGSPVGCFSYSNDASLLLPSSAMTTNYRVTGIRGDTRPGGLPPFDPTKDITSGYIAVTATQDATQLNIGLSGAANVLAGGGVAAGIAGTTLKLTLAKAGDVALIVAKKGQSQDLSGSLVNSDKPVQVISGSPCINMPTQNAASCDHVEESVFPAETLGKSYVVATPTRPSGGAGLHVLRFYGNVNGTTLSYSPAVPPGCPTALNAGQVVECGAVTTDIEVTGSHEFAISGFMVGATALSFAETRGDPSQSNFPSVEQFRTRYTFVSSDDYPINYVDIICKQTANVELDGVTVVDPFTAIGASGFGVRRVKLGAAMGGAHTLVGSTPLSAQVVGYGDSTSYQYPAGLNLNRIAPPPEAPK